MTLVSKVLIGQALLLVLLTGYGKPASSEDSFSPQLPASAATSNLAPKEVLTTKAYQGS